MAYGVRKGKEKQPKLVTPIKTQAAAAGSSAGAAPASATGTGGGAIAAAIFPNGNPYNTPVVDMDE